MKAIITNLTKRIGLIIALSGFLATAFATNTVNVTEFDSSFEEIKLGIENTIIEKGFVIDFNGNLSKMLENTANVADDATPVFKYAEFWQFCSSKITREMTSIDPMNIAYCPFVIFAYETTNEPGTVTIGYRPLPADPSDETNKMIKKINALLESIVVDAGQ